MFRMLMFIWPMSRAHESPFPPPKIAIVICICLKIDNIDETRWEVNAQKYSQRRLLEYLPLKRLMCHVISHAKMKNIPDGQRPDYTEWEAPETGALPIRKPAASRRSSAQRLPHSVQVLSNTFVLFFSSLITGNCCLVVSQSRFFTFQLIQAYWRLSKIIFTCSDGTQATSSTLLASLSPTLGKLIREVKSSY